MLTAAISCAAFAAVLLPSGAASAHQAPPPDGGRPAAPMPCEAAKNVPHALTADKLAQAYQLTPLYQAGRTGAGVTVGVIEAGPYSPTDVGVFAHCYGIAPPDIRVRRVLGGPYDYTNPDHTDFVIETLLSIAPNVRIRLYRVSTNSLSNWDLALAAAVSDKVQIISMSGAWCEEFAHAYFRWDFDRQAQLLLSAAGQSQTMIAASGNNGSDCEPTGTLNRPETHGDVGVSLPATSPWVTAVGGTTLDLHGSHSNESVWNNDNGSSGGGVSRYLGMPDWQEPLTRGVDTRGATCLSSAATCREVPDVSADADPSTGYVIYENGRWRSAGGTSGSTPLWSGLVALMDQGCGNDVAGYLNPKLYAAAERSGYPNGPKSAFHDVTDGTNDVHGNGRYPAGPGFDLASGLGTPDGWNLTPYLSCKPEVSSVTPSAGPVAGGTRVTITGSGFDWDPSAIGVTFGSAGVGTDVEVLSPTKLQVTAPRSPVAQQVDVTVTTPAGTSEVDSHDHFFYEPDPGATVAPGDQGFSDWESGGFLLSGTSWAPHLYSMFGPQAAPLPDGCFYRAGLALTPMAFDVMQEYEHVYAGAHWSLSRLTPGWSYEVDAYLPPPRCFDRTLWSGRMYPNATSFSVTDRTGEHHTDVAEDGLYSAWAALGHFEADAHGRIFVSFTADDTPGLVVAGSGGAAELVAPRDVLVSAVRAAPLPPTAPAPQPATATAPAPSPRTTRLGAATRHHTPTAARAGWALTEASPQHYNTPSTTACLPCPPRSSTA